MYELGKKRCDTRLISKKVVDQEGPGSDREADVSTNMYTIFGICSVS